MNSNDVKLGALLVVLFAVLLVGLRTVRELRRQSRTNASAPTTAVGTESARVIYLLDLARESPLTKRGS
jgi:predicted secreted protein